MSYEIIGDIHGHARILAALLEKLGCPLVEPPRAHLPGRLAGPSGLGDPNPRR